MSPYRWKFGPFAWLLNKPHGVHLWQKRSDGWELWICFGRFAVRGARGIIE